jgi:hypothetical protein
MAKYYTSNKNPICSAEVGGGAVDSRSAPVSR